MKMKINAEDDKAEPDKVHAGDPMRKAEPVFRKPRTSRAERKGGETVVPGQPRTRIAPLRTHFKIWGKHAEGD